MTLQQRLPLNGSLGMALPFIDCVISLRKVGKIWEGLFKITKHRIILEDWWRFEWYHNGDLKGATKKEESHVSFQILLAIDLSVLSSQRAVPELGGESCTTSSPNRSTNLPSITELKMNWWATTSHLILVVLCQRCFATKWLVFECTWRYPSSYKEIHQTMSKISTIAWPDRYPKRKCNDTTKLIVDDELKDIVVGIFSVFDNEKGGEIESVMKDR